MTKDDAYPNYRRYIQGQNEAGLLGHLAEQAGLGLDELREVLDGAPITDDIAHHLALVTQPVDDAWSLDPDDPAFNDHPNLSSQEIIDRLRFARSEGVLGVVAAVSGVKGGVKTLEDLCDKGGKIDFVTKSLLLNVMTEEGIDD
jgi:hypothetical protein